MFKSKPAPNRVSIPMSFENVDKVTLLKFKLCNGTYRLQLFLKSNAHARIFKTRHIIVISCSYFLPTRGVRSGGIFDQSYNATHWDDPLPADIYDNWVIFVFNLPSLLSIRVLRHFKLYRSVPTRF